MQRGDDHDGTTPSDRPSSPATALCAAWSDLDRGWQASIAGGLFVAALALL